jgi:hypothetical protein
MVMGGGDDVLERTLKAVKAGAAAPPTALSRAIDAGGADTVGVMRIDLGAIMNGVGELMAASGQPMPKPSAPPEPVVLTCTVNAGSDELRGRASIDVGKAVKLFGAMMPK